MMMHGPTNIKFIVPIQLKVNATPPVKAKFANYCGLAKFAANLIKETLLFDKFII